MSRQAFDSIARITRRGGRCTTSKGKAFRFVMDLWPVISALTVAAMISLWGCPALPALRCIFQRHLPHPAARQLLAVGLGISSSSSSSTFFQEPAALRAPRGPFICAVGIYPAVSGAGRSRLSTWYLLACTCSEKMTRQNRLCAAHMDIWSLAMAALVHAHVCTVDICNNK